MVGRLKMSCKEILWRNKSDNKIQEKPHQLFTISKNHVITETKAVNSNKKRTAPKTRRIVPKTTTTTVPLVVQTLTPTKRLPTITTQTIQTNKMTKNQNLSTHPVRPMAKLTIPKRIVTLEQTQLIDRLPEQMTGETESVATNKCSK